MFIIYIRLFNIIIILEKHILKSLLNQNIINKNWFRIIKYKILPSRNLYHLLLSVKIMINKNKELLFLLFLKCSEKKSKMYCHKDDEGIVTGTWATIEGNKAIEKSYKNSRNL